MTREQYVRFQDELTVRELKTTLEPWSLHCSITTESGSRPVGSVLPTLKCGALDLRNIKVTLGVDGLSCRTPQMVVKELWVHLLTYKLIRLLMAQAACGQRR